LRSGGGKTKVLEMRKWSAMTFFRSAALPGWFVLALLILSSNAQNLGISRPRFGRSYDITSPYAIEEQEMMQANESKERRESEVWHFAEQERVPIGAQTLANAS